MTVVIWRKITKLLISLMISVGKLASQENKASDEGPIKSMSHQIWRQMQNSITKPEVGYKSRMVAVLFPGYDSIQLSTLTDAVQ